MDEMFVNVSVVTSVGVQCETTKAKMVWYKLCENILTETPRPIREK